MVPLGHHGNRPMLLIRLDTELQIYQAYRYPKGHLKLRFKKLDHCIIPGQLKYVVGHSFNITVQSSIF